MSDTAIDSKTLNKTEFVQEVIRDYKIAFESRQASLIGRKEVLTGKAKFGIFGDGKEIAQLAMAKFFRKGDFRSGYYRDQTFMFAKGMSDIKAFFAQLYANPSVELEPSSAGRSMNGHFGTRFLNENGTWQKLNEMYNSSADISPTAGQMPRLLGLAYASKLYRENQDLQFLSDFSFNGNEIAFGTIGNASTSEGPFWEVINAAGVLQVPMLVSIWDDEYGISVHAKHQTTKENIGAILSGFQSNEQGKGYQIFTSKGWDYAHLMQTYEKAVKICRTEHQPVIIHVTEVTQPQGHSTSGSHERYKSKERLQWETEYDGIKKMRQWMIDNQISTDSELTELENESIQNVKQIQKQAWLEFTNPIKQQIEEVRQIIQLSETQQYIAIIDQLKNINEPQRKDIATAIHQILRLEKKLNTNKIEPLNNWFEKFNLENQDHYNSHVYSQSNTNISQVKQVVKIYSDNSAELDGREIVNAFFDYALAKYPELVAFGEDVGKIGDVNQGFAGLQAKYGELRVSDTGIRELSIVGQAIGLAMRGLRPIAEIQYLDYLLYAIQIISDDLATLQYRTKGGQKAPLIIRTRGHRLEGVWHSGSPMGMIINAVRGVHVLVPRNMTQAAGFYNTLLQADEPAIVIECLNGYRLKEKMPDNMGLYTTPIGVPEILIKGTDITVVSYGSTLRVIEDAIKMLNEFEISVELIDVQSLLPFDINHSIVESIKKTNKVVFIDEDVPSGATSYMMQQVLELQNGYQYLDSAPLSITAKEHRPAYGTDGDYFSKPNAEQIFDTLYNMMSGYHPLKWN